MAEVKQVQAREGRVQGEDSLHCPPRRTFGGSTRPRTEEKDNAQLPHNNTCPPTHCTPNDQSQLR